ncbi:hypothetical protein XJ44_07375 [Thermosipho affectus]|uniref:Uncharacterized protein n=2 Tax=Thermosipho affectus TaxID=660294 RepID=A0ABX3IHF8_9BACT|nr:hypothetical protein XJ44_07375 [Thermosipho affectus]
MINAFLISLISGALGLLISVLTVFFIVISNSFFKYNTFRFFNEIMVLGFGILGWYFIPSGILCFLFFLLISTLYQIYRIIREIYSIDVRFRILVLALGKDRFEYSLFSIKRVRKRIIGSFFKLLVILIASYAISQSLHAMLVGVISLLVGVILIFLKLD